MSDFAQVIDGRTVASDSTFPVIDPSTGEAFTECPDCSQAQLDDAMNAAQKAFRPWAADEAARRQALVRCAEVLAPQAEAIGEILTREQGKPLQDAIGEVHGAAFWLQHTAGLELLVEQLHEDDETRV
jgi:acyl-CoA reductase-like NAD-dependent aldehyde dehydrogenase